MLPFPYNILPIMLHCNLSKPTPSPTSRTQTATTQTTVVKSTSVVNSAVNFASFSLPSDEIGRVTVLRSLEDTLKETLQAGLDPSITVVQASVTSVNGIDVSGLTRRRLTQGEVLWQAVMEAVTTVVTVITDGILASATVNGVEQPLNNIAGSSSSAVVDAVADQDTIGDLFLASVIHAMDNAIDSSATGENLFMTTFQATVAEAAAATGDSALTASLTALIENLAVTSVATDQTQDVRLVQQLDISPTVTEIIEILTALNLWYPDWSTPSSKKCLNDGNAPHYMRNKYFENSRASCCEKYFSWDYISCAGGSLDLPTGFYPDWKSNKDKCVDATDTMPDYSERFFLISCVLYLFCGSFSLTLHLLLCIGSEKESKIMAILYC